MVDLRSHARGVASRLTARTRKGWYFPTGAPNKVFCVGFNKTATTSLTRLLKDLGLTTCHDPEWARVVDMTDPLLAQYDAFSDGECADIEALDLAFPGSKFVLNTRALDRWLVSRVRWVEHRRDLGKTGRMRRELDELGVEAAVLRWAAVRDEYHRHVVQYFSRRPRDLLVIDVEADGDVEARLGRFLGANPMARTTIEHRNASTRPRADQDVLLQRVRGILLEAGYPEAGLSSDLFATPVDPRV